MEKINSSPFEALALPENCEAKVQNNILSVKKWNWDFQETLAFQKRAQEIVKHNRALKVFIFCNHPHCFTLGRGNERGAADLLDFNPALSNQLKFPVHQIHRGGGITFHYPGQWIFYPIVSIGPSHSLEDHMCWLLKSVAQVLRSGLELENVVTAKKLMGVWKDKKKLASVGVGVSRFVTEHGLALNLQRDEEMFNELGKINPCGMNAETYNSVDSYVDEENLLEKFDRLYSNSFFKTGSN